MSVSYQSEKTFIARLRVRGAGLDPALARLRLTSLLNTVALRPGGLAPNALVIIKELRDPLPGHLRLQQAGTRPPPDWERAVGSRLEQLLRSALRPALGHVDDRAEAVIFLDRSELLACLASDWCRTGTLMRWWWRSLFDSTDARTTVVRTWLEATEYIPAALNRLAKRREAVPFLRALRTVDAQQILSGLLQSFALHKLEPVLRAGLDVKDYATSDELTGGRGRMPAYGSAGRLYYGVAAREPPWHPFTPETESSGLEPDSECLLGIALMLQRAPSVARSEAFARALFSWRRSFVDESPAHAFDKDEAASSVSQDEAEEAPKARVMKPAHAALREPASRFETDKPGLEAALPPSSPAGTSTRPAHDPEAARADAAITPDGPRHFTPPVPALARPMFEAAETLPEVEATECETEIGGIFYLINLGLFLGLYGDFTSPEECDPSLSIWDFVALLGRELLGPKIESDTVWPLLASFACRTEQESPGVNFRAPEDWRMPAHWLETFSEKANWRWTIRCGRLLVTHAKGFRVLDVPLTEADAAAQLSLELQNYQGVADVEFYQEASQEGTEIEPLHRWLGWLMPYVTVRLQQALGLSVAGDLPRVLCEHRARVAVTATHLDIFMRLAELPVEIRLAGLDRDPGWVPSAGKFIAFHFE
jgi:hypothetical protein